MVKERSGPLIGAERVLGDDAEVVGGSGLEALDRGAAGNVGGAGTGAAGVGSGGAVGAFGFGVGGVSYSKW